MRPLRYLRGGEMHRFLMFTAVWAVATGTENRQTLEHARPDRLLNHLQELVAEIGDV